MPPSDHGLEAEPAAQARSSAALIDADLYLRGAETLLASWEEYARGTTGAAVDRLPGVAVAVFPNEPERAIYNNALLERDLAAAERALALDAMEAAYAAAGVGRFAAWVHESDHAMRFDLERRGYTFDQTTRAMGMVLDDVRLPRPQIELGPADWFEYLRIIGVPPRFLSGADRAAFHVLVARFEGENVAAAMAFDHDGDCGIYNVGTLQHFRRRGLGTALTALHIHDALARGCQTASLQSTEIAERVYTAVGFRDLGRILEYVPTVVDGYGRAPVHQECAGSAASAPSTVARMLPSGPVTISAARADDLTSLVEIERAAGETFRSLGMDLVADDDPGSPEELTAYVEGGRAFVALGVDDRALGYLLLDVVDDAAHIEQVSVHPDHARQGIGRALIERAAAWATARDLRALTLTTYVDVPWNGAYYERLGFRYLDREEETPGLRDIRQHERAAGLDAWPRACMRRSLTPDSLS